MTTTMTTNTITVEVVDGKWWRWGRMNGPRAQMRAENSLTIIIEYERQSVACQSLFVINAITSIRCCHTLFRHLVLSNELQIISQNQLCAFVRSYLIMSLNIYLRVLRTWIFYWIRFLFDFYATKYAPLNVVNHYLYYFFSLFSWSCRLLHFDNSIWFDWAPLHLVPSIRPFVHPFSWLSN